MRLYSKSVTLKKLWHILNILVFLLVGGTTKNSGTYLKYSYGWRLVAGDLGGATRGMLRHPNPLGQTPYTKPLILCFEALILLTPSSLQQVHSEKCLWLFSCFSLKHCWHFKGCFWYELSSCQSCHFQICQNMFFLLIELILSDIVTVGGLTTRHFCGSQILTNPSLILDAVSSLLS